jgi:hypothetical protein
LSNAAKSEEPSHTCEMDKVATVTGTVTKLYAKAIDVTDVTGDCLITKIFADGRVENCNVGDTVAATGKFDDDEGGVAPAVFHSTYSCTSSK